MKNRVTFLLVAILIGSILVGCGENQNTSNLNNNEVDANTQMNSSVLEENNGLATIRTDVEYIEKEYCYVVANEKYLDTTYVDGEELDVSDWEKVYETITINEPIDMFSGKKAMIGYLKAGIGCIHVSTNGEWSRVAFGTELGEMGDFPKGNVIVRTKDLEAVKEVTGVVEGNVPQEMSSGVKEYFAKIKNGIAEENQRREVFQKENPAVPLLPLEEVESIDGLEYLHTFGFEFDCEEGYEMAMDVIREEIYNQEYTKYYIEYIGETMDVVEFKLYVGK